MALNILTPGVSQTLELGTEQTLLASLRKFLLVSLWVAVDWPPKKLYCLGKGESRKTYEESQLHDDSTESTVIIRCCTLKRIKICDMFESSTCRKALSTFDASRLGSTQKDLQGHSPAQDWHARPGHRPTSRSSPTTKWVSHDWTRISIDITTSHKEMRRKFSSWKLNFPEKFLF